MNITILFPFCCNDLVRLFCYDCSDRIGYQLNNFWINWDWVKRLSLRSAAVDSILMALPYFARFASPDECEKLRQRNMRQRAVADHIVFPQIPTINPTMDDEKKKHNKKHFGFSGEWNGVMSCILLAQSDLVVCSYRCRGHKLDLVEVQLN